MINFVDETDSGILLVFIEERVIHVDDFMEHRQKYAKRVNTVDKLSDQANMAIKALR